MPCFSTREGVQQHALARRLKTAAGQALEHAEQDQLAETAVAMPHSPEARVKTAIDSRK